MSTTGKETIVEETQAGFGEKEVDIQTETFLSSDNDFENSATLTPKNITVCDAKFMGVYSKRFNDDQNKHIDLLYNSDAENVDVIRSVKGSLTVR